MADQALDPELGRLLRQAMRAEVAKLPVTITPSDVLERRRLRAGPGSRLRRLLGTPTARGLLSFAGAAVVAVIAVGLASALLVGPPRVAAPPPAPEVAQLLKSFLDARIAGEGARQFVDEVNTNVDDIPLLYTTSAGARYERGDFEPVLGIEWPYGWTAFKIRLYAGNAAVEQLMFVTTVDGELKLDYQGDGFATTIAPTTEDGQPVASSFAYLDGKVSLRAAHPWVFAGAYTQQIGFGWLIPQGRDVRPTTDGGSRGDWDRFYLIAHPMVVGNDCLESGTASAEALADEVRASPGVAATVPSKVRVGTSQALALDVVINAGTSISTPTDTDGNECPNGLLFSLFDNKSSVSYQNGLATGRASGDRMRLYLVNAPAGSSLKVVAIAIVAPDSTYERAVAAAAPVLDTIEFYAP